MLRQRAHADAEGRWEIVVPLRDTDYRSREYSARDFRANLWSFRTYDPWAGHK